MTTPAEQGERAARLEVAYQEHIDREGNQQWNQHPDGCWHCGSDKHHSGDCPDRDDA